MARACGIPHVKSSISFQHFDILVAVFLCMRNREACSFSHPFISSPDIGGKMWQVGRGTTAAALRGALGTLGRPGIRTLICDFDDFLDSFGLTKKHFPAYIFDLWAFLCNWSPCQTSHPKTHTEPFRSSASRSASARSVFNLKCEAISNHFYLEEYAPWRL